MCDQQELDKVRAERDVYLRALHWYAHPDQWETLKDDRGRETLVWRWGDDGGEVARRALRIAGTLGKPASNTDAQGAVGLASGGAVIVGDAAPSGWDSSMHEPADEPSWMAGMSRIE